MSLAETEAHRPLRAKARNVLMGREPDILAEIDAPGVAATIWTRACDQAFQSWIDALPFEQLPELRTIVPVHLAEAAAIAACEQANVPKSPEMDMLTGDVGALAMMLAKSLKVRQVRVRLDVSDEVMCPKFHVDNVPARLLCTYRGKGTEYVPMGHENDQQSVRQVTRGAVALFRGGAWPGEERTGLFHRSPDPEPLSGHRLLLVIDPME
ncbi:DUF1826 domain-containing protein [Roseibium sp. HPY-6]|uniref:DUF1826 domain-containing protein n=1 Tax=Roseibium sp. HPY-6 TaxID=3229852 RepID=UPI0033906A2C